MTEQKLYELRYYRVAAQDAGRFRSLADEHVPMRARRSRLIGFWGTELGAVNHVMHIWEYDSLTHRKAVRDEMSANAEWAGFLKQASPMFQTMHNWLCRPLAGDFRAVWSDKDFYKFTTLRYQQSDSQAAARDRFLASISGISRVKAALETAIGTGREFCLLESADNLDNLLIGSPFDDEANVSIETKILSPYPWNQWIKDE